MDSNQITQLAYRLLHRHKEISKEDELTPEAVERVSQRIKRIQAGLAPEMEFVAAVNWLSKVVCIHRLDQTPIPRYTTSLDEVQVPDLLAIVRYEDKLLPVLIEVKTKEAKKLVWKESYLKSLQRYAEIVHMPLLIAWKHMHIWVLVEPKHFEKRVSAYHLAFSKALTENLMCILFGDIAVQLNDHFEFFIDAITETELPPMPNLIPEGGYQLTITNAGFTIDKKEATVGAEFFWMFLAAESKDEIIRLAQQKLRIQFTPQTNSLFSLSHLWYVVATFPDEEHHDWEEIMQTPLTLTAEGVRQHLRSGIEQGMVKYVFDLQPHTMPDFLRLDADPPTDGAQIVGSHTPEKKR